MYMYVYIDRLIINETTIESTIRRMKRKEEKKSTFEHAQKYDLSIETPFLFLFFDFRIIEIFLFRKKLGKNLSAYQLEL